MKQILVNLDDETARLLERVAPGRGRKRSKFIRMAIVKALMDVAEDQTRVSYERWPDELDEDGWAPERYAIHPTPAQMRQIEKARRTRQAAAKPRTRRRGPRI